MTDVISKNGKKMTHVATRVITPVKDTTPKNVLLPAKQQRRRAENEEYLKNKNVKAFLDTLAKIEGGDYHAKFGYGWRRVGKLENGLLVMSLPIQVQVPVVQLQRQVDIRLRNPHGKHFPLKQWVI
ncbi:hypothetical protein QNM99_27055 [Pseudomonas sp. PCH446]